MSKLDIALHQWHALKKELKELTEKEEVLRNKIKKVLEIKKVSTLASERYKVSSRMMSRETLSKKNCPSDVWKQYAKKSTFQVIKLEQIVEKTEEEIDLED